MRYKIQKDQHYSRLFPRITSIKDFKFEFYLDKSCLYQLHTADDLDVNKLYGFTFGLTNHHKESIRIGWNCEKNNGTISLFAYWYSNGIRRIQFLKNIKPNTKHTCSIEILPYGVLITLDGIQYPIDYITKLKWPYLGFVLGFYFGGNNPAPHQMIANITKI
jgi:hypothetical protein